MVRRTCEPHPARSRGPSRPGRLDGLADSAGSHLGFWWSAVIQAVVGKFTIVRQMGDNWPHDTGGRVWSGCHLFFVLLRRGSAGQVVVPSAAVGPHTSSAVTASMVSVMICDLSVRPDPNPPFKRQARIDPRPITRASRLRDLHGLGGRSVVHWRWLRSVGRHGRQPLRAYPRLDAAGQARANVGRACPVVSIRVLAGRSARAAEERVRPIWLMGGAGVSW